MNFNGKVVLVISATSRIGIDAAHIFANKGATLVLVGLKQNSNFLKFTVEQLLAKDSHKPNSIPEPVQIIADVTKESDAQRIISTTLAKCHRLDVLVNAVTLTKKEAFEKTRLEQYDSVMDVNMRSVLHITKLAIPELVKTKGNIINISSVCGMSALPNTLPNAIAKAAIDQFTRCVALDLAAEGVRCNCVHIDATSEEYIRRPDKDREAFQKFRAHCKTIREPWGENIVANALLFLASDSASSITGVALPVHTGVFVFTYPQYLERQH